MEQVRQLARTAPSKGTKVFALGGKVNNVGLVEVPMGTTLRELIYDIGGGIPGGKEFKAIQTGGPSGGCLTEEDLDTPIDFDNLVAKGSMMGSGGAIVMDEDNCMVDVAKFYMGFICDESCGKCTPCRIGTRRMLEMLEKHHRGQGHHGGSRRAGGPRQDDQDQLALRPRPDGPEPDPLDAALLQGRVHRPRARQEVPGPRLQEPDGYHIDPDKCKGCTKCARNCPVGAITGEIKKQHVIDQAKCIKCGACIDNCPFKAIVKE